MSEVCGGVRVCAGMPLIGLPWVNEMTQPSVSKAWMQMHRPAAKPAVQAASTRAHCHSPTPPAQAGEKVKAMKALLRSGDMEKIIFFTGAMRGSARMHACM